MSSIPVALVESDHALRQTLNGWIDSAPACVCVCACAFAEEAELKVPPSGATVIIINVHLRGGSGIHCAASLRQRMPGLAVIMVSQQQHQDLAFQALRAGACGYLVLEFSTKEFFLRAIAEAASGGAPLTSSVARRLVDAFREPPNTHSVLADLSPRELEVIRLLANGLSNKQIAAQLNISYETACVHLRRIYDKFHVQSRTEALLKYLEAQQPPRAAADLAPAPLNEHSTADLELLLQENLRLAAELERNSRTLLRMRAKNPSPSHAGAKSPLIPSVPTGLAQ
jgi:DNA-binding NarL/FixJ family response regulator